MTVQSVRVYGRLPWHYDGRLYEAYDVSLCVTWEGAVGIFM